MFSELRFQLLWVVSGIKSKRQKLLNACVAVFFCCCCSYSKWCVFWCVCVFVNQSNTWFKWLPLTKHQSIQAICHSSLSAPLGPAHTVPTYDHCLDCWFGGGLHCCFPELFLTWCLILSSLTLSSEPLFVFFPHHHYLLLSCPHSHSSFVPFLFFYSIFSLQCVSPSEIIPGFRLIRMAAH